MKGLLAIFILFSVSIVSCKSNKDLATETPAEEPMVEIADTIQPDPIAEESLASENTGPSLDTTSLSAPEPQIENIPQGSQAQSNANQQAMDDGGSGYMVQLESVMGSPKKATYKGIKDLSFEKGADGYTRIFLGKELGRTAAETLRDEYKLRGFAGAFVVSKGSTEQGSAGSVSDASLSSQSLDKAQGIVYLIQLSAFQGPAETKALAKLGWYQVLEFDDGWKRVYSGAYSSLLNAQDALKKYRRKGFKDCYVVPFEGYTNKLNGKIGKVSATSQQ